MKIALTFVLCLMLLCCALDSSRLMMELPIPSRPRTESTGSTLVAFLAELSLQDREFEIQESLVLGNVPPFLRRLQPVTVTELVSGSMCVLTYWVTPDYLALGSDDDCFLCPMTPRLAQELADRFGCILPTRKMVDQIYAQADVKLEPSPIPPSELMSTVPVFWQHHQTVWQQRQERLSEHPLGTLVAGHKKDVVITPRLATKPTSVAIYGWHRTDGNPIQPLYLGHSSNYADYSHGIRLVSRRAHLDGRELDLLEILNDPALCVLLSDEGLVPQPRYPTR